MYEIQHDLQKKTFLKIYLCVKRQAVALVRGSSINYFLRVARQTADVK